MDIHIYFSFKWYIGNLLGKFWGWGFFLGRFDDVFF